LVCRSAGDAAARFGIPANPINLTDPINPNAVSVNSTPINPSLASTAPVNSTPINPSFASAASPASGAVWTPTGRPFFPPALTSTLVDRMRAAAEQAGLFDEL